MTDIPYGDVRAGAKIMIKRGSEERRLWLPCEGSPEECAELIKESLLVYISWEPDWLSLSYERVKKRAYDLVERDKKLQRPASLRLLQQQEFPPSVSMYDWQPDWSFVIEIAMCLISKHIAITLDEQRRLHNASNQ